MYNKLVFCICSINKNILTYNIFYYCTTFNIITSFFNFIASSLLMCHHFHCIIFT
ncbi:hypothetical protein ManeNPV_00078 [Malacosoma neustria nucleopolyhedrovirus]|uniref:hypothetical protein n=1 Tax=Malacosoma neustria nuclear polyhedrosis virus TaxID=38012 RepID=UPI000E35F561|nr:hypothetical protein ManeNPV_00078 [Malacosoma neustria nucleopolyhedrovirus]AUF81605.1 hypothetical protein ManeNPV_00078 [Malacosoma neustria nucleopolyhedrovirus]